METEQRWEGFGMLSQDFLPAKAYFVQKHEAHFLPLSVECKAPPQHMQTGQSLVC